MNNLVLVIGCILLARGYADPPTLTATYQESGNVISSPAELLFGTTVTWRCKFDKFQPAGSAAVYVTRVLLRTKAKDSNNVPVAQAQCEYTKVGNENPNLVSRVPADSTLGIVDNDINCGVDFASFTANVLLSDTVTYDCLYEDVTGEQLIVLPSNPFMLDTYSMPSLPVINMDPSELKEGNPVTFLCTSSAQPAPVLRIKLGGVVQETSTNVGTGNPGAIVQSSVVWNTTASSSMHSKELRCEVDITQHPHKEERATTETLKIIYGPEDDQTTEPEKELNTRSDGESVTLTCDMDGYPMEFKWMKDSTFLQDGEELVVTADYAKDIDQYPVTLTFTCVGTNTNTKKTANKDYQVKFIESSVTPGTNNRGPVGESTPKDGLATGAIAGIVVAVLVVVVVVIIITVCMVIKRRGSSNDAAKAKAAQARRPSDEKTEEPRYNAGGAYGYGASNNTMDRNTYSENATLQMENRYGNMGQYADVIDDRPRSRKPIAAFDETMLDEGPPTYDGPPAYVDTNPYRSDPSYMTYSPSYGSSYGAPC